MTHLRSIEIRLSGLTRRNDQRKIYSTKYIRRGALLHSTNTYSLSASFSFPLSVCLDVARLTLTSYICISFSPFLYLPAFEYESRWNISGQTGDRRNYELQAERYTHSYTQSHPTHTHHINMQLNWFKGMEARCYMYRVRGYVHECLRVHKRILYHTWCGNTLSRRMFSFAFVVGSTATHHRHIIFSFLF